MVTCIDIMYVLCQLCLFLLLVLQHLYRRRHVFKRWLSVVGWSKISKIVDYYNETLVNPSLWIYSRGKGSHSSYRREGVLLMLMLLYRDIELLPDSMAGAEFQTLTLKKGFKFVHENIKRIGKQMICFKNL